MKISTTNSHVLLGPGRLLKRTCECLFNVMRTRLECDVAVRC